MRRGPRSSRDRSARPPSSEFFARLRRDRNTDGGVNAGLLLIVSPTKVGTYAYMKLVSEKEDVVTLDRRRVDRRQIQQRVMPERRHGERRRRDVMTDLQKSGWALVRR